MNQNSQRVVDIEGKDLSHRRVMFDLSDYSRPLCESITGSVSRMRGIKNAKLNKHGKLIYQRHPRLLQTSPHELKEEVENLIHHRIKISPKLPQPASNSRNRPSNAKGYVNRKPVLTT